MSQVWDRAEFCVWVGWQTYEVNYLSQTFVKQNILLHFILKSQRAMAVRVSSGIDSGVAKWRYYYEKNVFKWKFKYLIVMSFLVNLLTFLRPLFPHYLIQILWELVYNYIKLILTTYPINICSIFFLHS